MRRLFVLFQMTPIWARRWSTATRPTCGAPTIPAACKPVLWPGSPTRPGRPIRPARPRAGRSRWPFSPRSSTTIAAASLLRHATAGAAGGHGGTLLTDDARRLLVIAGATTRCRPSWRSTAANSAADRAGRRHPQRAGVIAGTAQTDAGQLENAAPTLPAAVERRSLSRLTMMPAAYYAHGTKANLLQRAGPGRAEQPARGSPAAQ